MIVCESLSKVYATQRGEVRSLNQVDLKIQRNEFLTVRGASGSGKTTLLLALGGMLHPSSGRLWFNEVDLYQLSGQRRADFRARSIGFVFQMFHLVPYLTTLENIMLAHTGRNGASVRSRALGLVEELGLQERCHHRPSELSAGERQRTAMGRALLNQPEILLADEPTGNLDPGNAEEVFRHLERFHQRGGTVVVVTHGQTAERFSNRVIRLEKGRVVESGDGDGAGKDGQG